MPIYQLLHWIRYVRFRIVIILLGQLLWIGWVLLPWDCPAATIVLDPGHGGLDAGAGSGQDLSEKQFTLALAEKVAGLLAANHQIELARTADIEIMPQNRAAVANHIKADLMVSLHAAVAPYCSGRSIAIYYHNDEHLSTASATSGKSRLSETVTGEPVWNKCQIRHRLQSQQAAATIARSLSDHSVFERITVNGVALVTLMGADMPAILIEVGCIHQSTVPTSQILMQQIDAYGRSIAAAIDAVLTDPGP